MNCCKAIQTYKSATQQKLNSSNAAGYIKFFLFVLMWHLKLALDKTIDTLHLS